MFFGLRILIQKFSSSNTAFYQQAADNLSHQYQLLISYQLKQWHPLPSTRDLSCSLMTTHPQAKEMLL
jgi:hypothetical protein